MNSDSDLSLTYKFETSEIVSSEILSSESNDFNTETESSSSNIKSETIDSNIEIVTNYYPYIAGYYLNNQNSSIKLFSF